MRLYGYLKEVIETWFKKDGYDVKVTPNSNTYVGTTTFSLPPATSGSDTIVGAAASQTLTNKSISGASNTVTNISLTTAVTGTLPVANGGTGTTTSTGSGSVVLSTSPTLTTPNLGTPSAATLTNATGLPVSTGISGLGANIAAFLATPSSANLAAALTDETGSGAAVFATSPTLTTPNIGVATATSVNGTSIPASKTLVVTTDKLNVLAATTSAELAGVISDETGTGALVFGSSPTIITPTIDDYLDINEETAPGTPASGKVRIYAKSDAKIYKKDDAGTETQLATTAEALSNPMTTAGDIIYGGTSGAATRLAGDTSNIKKWLRSLSTGGTAAAPTWEEVDQVKGRTDGVAVSAGYVGQEIIASRGRASASGLTTATSAAIVQLDLTEGSWLLSCTAGFTGTATATSQVRWGLSTSSGATPGTAEWDAGLGGAISASNNLNTIDLVQATRPVRIDVSGATTYYLVVYAAFTGGTCSAYGQISAIRKA